MAGARRQGGGKGGGGMQPSPLQPQQPNGRWAKGSYWRAEARRRRKLRVT